MKYLPKETCEYLFSLGCTSESQAGCGYVGNEVLPAFSLEDILRKDTITKIRDVVRANMKSRIDDIDIAEHFAWLVYNHPDTWPEEVAKLITPHEKD